MPHTRTVRELWIEISVILFVKSMIQKIPDHAVDANHIFMGFVSIKICNFSDNTVGYLRVEHAVTVHTILIDKR